MSIEMYGWEPTFELLVEAHMPKVTSIIERDMVPAIFHVCIEMVTAIFQVCIGFLVLEASSTP